MSRQARILATLSSAAVATIAAVTVARGGFYSPPPPDVTPVWSPDGSVIVYFRTGEGLHVVNPDGTHDRLLAGLPREPTFVFSRDWRWIVFNVFSGTPRTGTLEAMRPDGTGARVLARDAIAGMAPSVSPDGTRVAYTATDGVRIVGIDGSNAHRVAAGGRPAWSPDGRRLAFFDARAPRNPPIGVLDLTDGSLTQVAAGGEDRDDAFAWSPDGSRLAFVARMPSRTTLLGIRDTASGSLETFAIPSWVSKLEWRPDGNAVVFPGPQTLQVDARTGVATDLGPGNWDLAIAPNGSRAAYSATGECADRAGIHVRTLTSAEAVRISNDCHVHGTDGPDRLTSSSELYEIVEGLGGNDRLVGRGAPYVGDALDGGPGNDILIGGYWPEKLDGGPGEDVLYGGVNYDKLTGGPGRDRIYGQGGRDTVFARDGSRDVIDCGTNTGKTNTSPELDKAYVDRLDVVIRCERVFRSSR